MEIHCLSKSKHDYEVNHSVAMAHFRLRGSSRIATGYSSADCSRCITIHIVWQNTYTVCIVDNTPEWFHLESVNHCCLLFAFSPLLACESFSFIRCRSVYPGQTIRIGNAPYCSIWAQPSRMFEFVLVHAWRIHAVAVGMYESLFPVCDVVGSPSHLFLVLFLVACIHFFW